jgi:hypothetical protein
LRAVVPYPFILNLVYFSVDLLLLCHSLSTSLTVKFLSCHTVVYDMGNTELISHNYILLHWHPYLQLEYCQWCHIFILIWQTMCMTWEILYWLVIPTLYTLTPLWLTYEPTERVSEDTGRLAPRHLFLINYTDAIRCRWMHVYCIHVQLW